MKKVVVLLFLLVASIAQAQQVKDYVSKLPKASPARLVNDFAGVLTPEQQHTLEQKLIAYNDSTTTQIAIVTVKTTGDLDVSDVALEILREWGVGSKERNNGIVILASIDDRKIDIQTGYGMEGAVPDAIARNIIEYDIVPNFREANYYRGFDQATSSIFQAAAGEYKAPEGTSNRNKRKGGISLGKIILGLIILSVFISMKSGGNGGGGFMSRRGYRRFGGGPVIFPGGFGGSGGGFGGGGFGGGGFGGFGGGGGGGGGASGSW